MHYAHMCAIDCNRRQRNCAVHSLVVILIHLAFLRVEDNIVVLLYSAVLSNLSVLFLYI